MADKGTHLADDEVGTVAMAAVRKIARRLASRGLDVDGRPAPDAAEGDASIAPGEPTLLALADASVQGVVAMGPRRGDRPLRIKGAHAVGEAFVVGRRCAQVGGYNLHANVRISAGDRKGLEALCRYLGRPPIANERLTATDDGRVLLEMKRPWRDGTTHFSFTPAEFIQRLVALVPRPRRHLMRYHGVLAPAFAARAQVVPAGGDADAPAPQAKRPGRPAGETNGRPQPFPSRHPWAHLLWRVFKIDVLQCPRCAGRMDIVGAVVAADEVARILTHLGLPAAAPEMHQARPPPGAAQSEIHFGGGADPSDWNDPPPHDDPA